MPGSAVATMASMEVQGCASRGVMLAYQHFFQRRIARFCPTEGLFLRIFF
jgi:hypothetical protein